MKWIKLAWQNLGRNRRRTIATLALIAIGVTGIMSTSGFALYTYESLREFSMRENGHLILTMPEFFEQDEEFPLQFGIDNYQAIEQQLLSDTRIRTVLPSLSFNGLITNGDKSTIFVGSGVSAELPQVMGPALAVEQGRFLSLKPDESADFEIVIGKKLAQSLNAQIGSGLTLMSSTSDGALNAIDVEVRGIISTGIPDLDARFIMVHLNSAQFLLDTERVGQLGIYLRDNNAVASMQNEIQNTYRQMLVTPWSKRAFFYQSVKNLYDRIFGVMGVVILVMVGFAIFNTSAMSVLERMREIGTLKAMGTTQSEVVSLFLWESALLGAIGSVFGFLISGLMTLAFMVFEFQMPAPPGQTEGYPLQIYFSTDVALFALAGVVVLACLASLLSVGKSHRLTISEALRYA